MWLVGYEAACMSTSYVALGVFKSFNLGGCACIVSHSLVNANHLFRTEASSVITEACSH